MLLQNVAESRGFQLHGTGLPPGDVRVHIQHMQIGVVVGTALILTALALHTDDFILHFVTLLFLG